MAKQWLTEAIDLTDVRVDRENHVIHGVKLSGRASRNVHKRHGKPIRYSDRAIEQSVSLFESCPVTVRGGHNRENRDYTAQNGQLRNGRVEHLNTDKAASRFDWHLNSSDPLTPKILEDAEKFPQNCPLSQEVMEWAESLQTDHVLIESITENPMKIGVALVYRGGLNDSLFEALNEDEMEIKTKEELAARFPSLCEELTECACQAQKTAADDLTAQLTQAIAEREALKVEIDTLKGKLEEYKAEEQRLEREDEIKAAVVEQLGEEFEISEQLMGNLLSLYDGDGYKHILTTMAGLIEPKETSEMPSSTSGVRGAQKHQNNDRPRVGIHNRRF